MGLLLKCCSANEFIHSNSCKDYITHNPSHLKDAEESYIDSYKYLKIS